MRRAKFSVYIPPVIIEVTPFGRNGTIKQIKGGTGCHGPEQYGFFHCWMQIADQDGARPVAIVEDNDGKCHQVDVDKVHLMDPYPMP